MYPLETTRASGGIWQTRRIQVPVSARTWGFKSPLAHVFWGAPAGKGLGPMVTGGEEIRSPVDTIYEEPD